MLQSERSNLPTLELGEDTPFPQVVELQTTNVCNARCSVCPYEATTATLTQKGRMPDELIGRLIAECAEHRDEIAQIVPYHNNEPFADKRMIDILRQFKHKVGAAIELSTNASLMVKSKSEVLAAENLVDSLRISFFGASMLTYEARMKGLSWSTSTKNIKDLLELVDRFASSMRVEIILIADQGLTALEVETARKLWEPLGASVHLFGYLDRVGSNGERNLLPDHHLTATIHGCDLNRPFERICILTSGQTVLCSQDWKLETDLGNAMTTSISEIWNGDIYRNYRTALKGGTNPDRSFICRRCKLALFD